MVKKKVNKNEKNPSMAQVFGLQAT